MESLGWPIASSGLWSSGLRVLRSALHRPSAPPRAARPRSVLGPAEPSLSRRRICAQCSSEGAGPARLEASSPSHPHCGWHQGSDWECGNAPVPGAGRKRHPVVRRAQGLDGGRMQREGGLLGAGQLGGRLVWARRSADQDYSGSHIGRMI